MQTSKSKLHNLLCKNKHSYNLEVTHIVHEGQKKSILIRSEAYACPTLNNINNNPHF